MCCFKSGIFLGLKSHLWHLNSVLNKLLQTCGNGFIILPFSLTSLWTSKTMRNQMKLKNQLVAVAVVSTNRGHSKKNSC